VADRPGLCDSYIDFNSIRLFDLDRMTNPSRVYGGVYIYMVNRS